MIFVMLFYVLTSICMVKTIKNIVLMASVFLHEYVVGDVIKWDDDYFPNAII